ncbi:MAG: valine--tRNA ligase [Candidatus Paraimprobicoccus trichonymphae]|uniref:Valine--tRNA ligase n=1 Tax=Candidatus Paraimprobicoccus trichonymphae TaxID=3033793 RepID=A0AA48KXY0_9FIRM|nr:MAG: valine--tRNA ligase [Candidatus Paraimprobicoccus trichonymphae]
MRYKLDKIYNFDNIENKISKFWEENSFFYSKVDNNKKKYSIVIPPPNITGKLHMGHALDNTLQDILIRFKRMQGFNSLWVPGSDHASIATEAKIVENLKEKNLNKEKIGREKFLDYAWKWKEKYGEMITEQINKLGASCDWTKERFTLDENCNKAVIEFFVRLYEKNLIYRDKKMINWCPKCLTVISDSEVNFKEFDSKLYYVKYYLLNKKDYLVVATTRPETIFGDTAIAVGSEDSRYEKLIGQKVIVPLANREVTIIVDSSVEKNFGTGVLKVTPAHSMVDFKIGLKNNLDIIDIFDKTAVLNENGDKYENLDRYQARKEIVKDLIENNLIEKIEDIKNNIGTCYRCSCNIEPRISTQWFVKMKELAEPAIKVVKENKIKFIPKRFTKIYFHWMENINDWCISRQLWWGHRIPAFYCKNCNNIIVSRNRIEICTKCNSKNVIQDEDTLDTWFSSGLWPFSVFNWPKNTSELEYYYPTDVLVTGYDIIFFWVAKMIFSALEMTGKIPFKYVFVHGLVRDSQGRKMSKSLGNGINPLDIINKYGTDALRFALIMNNSPGNDTRFSDEKILSSRNFTNKIWNAARFISLNLENKNFNLELDLDNLLEIDKWILSRYNFVVKEITENLEKFELGVAIQKLYDFVWDEFCDWYIEFSKINLNNQVLIYLLINIVKLLHPFMPFITEEIWQIFNDYNFKEKKSISISNFPKFSKNLVFLESEKNVKNIIEIIKSVRNRRSELNISNNKRTHIYISSENYENYENLKKFKNILIKFCYAKNIEFNKKFDIENSIIVITNFSKIYIPLDELIDIKAEISRLEKELNLSNNNLENITKKLGDKNFIDKAPKNIVSKTIEIYENLKAKISKIKLELEKYVN